MVMVELEMRRRIRKDQEKLLPFLQRDGEERGSIKKKKKRFNCKLKKTNRTIKRNFLTEKSGESPAAGDRSSKERWKKVENGR